VSEKNARYLLEVMVIPENNPTEQKSISSVARGLGNVLNEYGQTPNAKYILDYCEKNKNVLDGFIEHNMLHLKIEPVEFEPGVDMPNEILNVVSNTEKSKVRVMLYPGSEGEVDPLKLPEATHNMNIRFDKDAKSFTPVTPHVNTPNFYQLVPSAKTASLYIEALLVDASMCHFMGISDAAMHHDEKQGISHDKVKFLLEYVYSDLFEKAGFSSQGATLIRHVTKKLTENVPYVSFLSIFTIASLDLNTEKVSFDVSFQDYCILWLAFQRWYYKKHQRMFSESNCSLGAIKALFDRNKFNGQISFDIAHKKIHDLITGTQNVKEVTSVLGYQKRYAFVILKNVPNANKHLKILDALFNGQIHQATWTIISWIDLKQFTLVRDFIEIIPFMIE